MLDIEKAKNDISGMQVRNLTVKDTQIYILYIPQITNRDSLSNNIIKPLLQYDGEQIITADIIKSFIIYIDDVFLDEDEKKISSYILEGKSIIIVSESHEYLVTNTLNIEKRNIQPPEVESSMRTPRDAFNENINSNISLIRYRIKDLHLKIDYSIVGKRSRTSVAVIYLQDVANEKYVTEIKKSLEEIDVDGVLESGYIQKYISNKNATLFSQIGISERSDSACSNILEGKVCILVQGSNFALITPKNFIESLDAGDDHYDNMYIGMCSKVLRFASLIMALTLSALYVTVVSFQPDILPAQYIITLGNSRAVVPVNAATEATLMEFLLELVREASIRLPKQIGASVSIVGTIVIGQAIVAAGLVSPLMIISAALASMAAFTVSDYSIMSSIRILKFLMIFLSGTFGIFGFISGLSIITIKISSITSFGVPYTAPIAPFNFKDIKKFLLSNVVLNRERFSFLNTKDTKRQ